MHTGIISFADRIAFNIKSNEFKDLILNKLYQLYNLKIIQKHYYVLNDTSAEHIKNNKYLCCLRSNGNPYYIFFTKYNDIPIIYFIDKKIHPNYQKPRIILVKGLFDISLFDNTLLDGEMIKTNSKKWELVFNDIISYKGQHLKTKKLSERLEIIYNLLATEHTPDSTIDVCTYKVKTYYNLHKDSITNLLELSKKLNYTSRGIYLWNDKINYKPILYNFNEENIKSVVREVKDETTFKILEESTNIIKNNTNNLTNINEIKENNTIENDEKILWINKTSEADVYNLYLKENINEKSIGIANVSTLVTSKLLRLAFKNTNASTLLKFKCKYNDIFKKWTPLNQVQ
jgi:hypothetical protein